MPAPLSRFPLLSSLRHQRATTGLARGRVALSQRISAPAGRQASTGATAHSLRVFAAFCVLLVVTLLHGCDTPRKKTPPQQGDSTGVTETTVRLASSLPLSGHASYLGQQTLRGAMTYINHVNDTGGVHGRMIELEARDDGYDPPRCLANTQQFLINANIFALFSYVGTPTTLRILPLVDDAAIPLVGIFSGGNALRTPFNRYIFNIRASYYQETAAAVRYFVQTRGMKRIAVFYQYDAYGFDGLTGAELALQELGLAPVARGFYSRGTTDVEEGMRRIMASEPDAVLMVGTYEPAARFIRKAEEAGLDAVFHCLSFTGPEELARLLAAGTHNEVIVSQVVPPPLVKQAPELLGIVSDYLTLLASYYPASTPSSVGLEGFVNARIMVEGLRRAGPDLTRERFVTALEELTDFSLGGQTRIHFGPQSRQGLQQVYFTTLRNGHFELMHQMSDVAPVSSQGPRAIPGRQVQP